MATRIQDHIINDLLTNIQNNTLKAGEKLPTNNELAQKYNTSAVTVRKSIAVLVSKGYLESVKRVGTFVKKREQGLFQIKFTPYTSVNEEITSSTIDNIHLTLARSNTSRIEQKAIQYSQIFYAEAIPICYHLLTVFINGHPDMNTIDKHADHYLRSLSKIIDSFDITKKIEITMATPNHYIQNKLLIDELSPVFCFTVFYMTKEDISIGKSIYYISGENIELHGKSVHS